jgi:hypothetical protein
MDGSADKQCCYHSSSKRIPGNRKEPSVIKDSGISQPLVVNSFYFLRFSVGLTCLETVDYFRKCWLRDYLVGEISLFKN